MNYTKLSFFLSQGDKDWFHVSRQKQEAYLNKLRTPKDTIDRGFLQYQCQKLFVSRWKRLIMEFASAFYFPIQLSVYLFRKKKFVRKVDAVSEFSNVPEVIPNKLLIEYSFDHNAWFTAPSLSLSDVLYCLGIAYRYPLSPLFVVKSTYRIALFSSFISSYRPNAIIEHHEYSFVSSIGTAYCRRCGVKHINIMHGDKLYWIRDAFFEYDECHIWSDHYRKLFVKMKAEPTQFIISVPESLKIDVKAYENNEYYADFKYYLDYYSDDEIHSIVDSILYVKELGATIKFRPHPRYSDLKLLRKYVDDSDIENPKEISIMESIANLRWAVGSSTTALIQAYYSGKGVVCDDITYSKQYKQLQEHDWALSSVDSIRLSQIRKVL